MRGIRPTLIAGLVMCSLTSAHCTGQNASGVDSLRVLKSGLSLLAQQKCVEAVPLFRDELVARHGSIDARLLLGIALDCSANHQALVSLFNDIWNYDLDPQEETPEIRLVQNALQSGWKIAPASSEGRYFSALLNCRVGNYGFAVSELNAAGEPVPGSWSYYNLLGTIYLREGRFADAGRTLQLALGRNNRQADTFYKLGTVALAMAETSEAVPHFREALRLRPDFPAASAALGIALLQNGDAQGAREALVNGTSVGPEVYFYLGQAYERLDNRDAAIEAYKQATVGRPQFFEALYSLGRVLLNVGRASDAVRYLEEAAQLKPDRAQVHLDLGMALVAAGQKDVAANAALSARDAGHGEAAEFQDALGALFQSIGRLDDARLSFEEAVKLDQTKDTYFRHLAAAQMSTSESEAIETLQAGITHIPNSARLHYLLGLMLLNRGSAAEAVEASRKATELEPRNADYRQSFGVCLATLERDGEAMQAFRQVLAINDHYAPAFLQVGILQLKAGESTKAEDSFKQAMRADPEYAPAYFRLGKIFYDRKNDSEALTLLDKARELDPNWEDTYFLLGMLYRRSGDQEKAANMLAVFRKKKNEVQDTRRTTYEKASTAFADSKAETAKQ